MENEILDYVMQSPENTNPNVLRDLLKSTKDSSESSIIEMIVDGENLLLNKTWQEIFNNKYDSIQYSEDSSNYKTFWYIASIGTNGNNYVVEAFYPEASGQSISNWHYAYFSTTEPDGYPSMGL